LPQERLSLRKIKEALRLHSLGLTQCQIARSCSIGQSTVSAYLKAAEAASIQYSAVADWEEQKLITALLSRQPPTAPTTRHPAPEFATIHLDLQKHQHLTLQLVWEEYQAANPGGYRYSRFCELYPYWRKKRDLVLRHEHRAGEKMFVDYAGDTIAVRNPSTGESRDTQLFVAVLGASNYTFAEATWTQGLGDLSSVNYFFGSPVSATFAPWPNHAVLPLQEEVAKWPGAVKGAPNGAAERALDREDHFERLNEGESSATTPGAEVDQVNWNYRGPLSHWRFSSERLAVTDFGGLFLSSAGVIDSGRNRFEIDVSSHIIERKLL
jgi:hypothetical protein